MSEAKQSKNARVGLGGPDLCPLCQETVNVALEIFHKLKPNGYYGLSRKKIRHCCLGKEKLLADILKKAEESYNDIEATLNAIKESTKAVAGKEKKDVQKLASQCQEILTTASQYLQKVKDAKNSRMAKSNFAEIGELGKKANALESQAAKIVSDVQQQKAKKNKEARKAAEEEMKA